MAALRDGGLIVQALDDHFDQDCEDQDWIPVVAAKAWVILTKDKGVRRRTGELEILRAHNAAAFILTSGNANAEDNAKAFLVARGRMLRLVSRYTRPLIATIGRSGAVTVMDGERAGGFKR